uniref:FYVE, RhoGEF and PH domain containing 6 n=1 Tax=Cynoglossus semilaevis TaxID=244447 RepID=A0A3P8V311_CYNSE
LHTGVKKPPLAPKPKLPAATKPSPPPIAPKPGILTQSSVVSHPSPATLKRTKPALAPKPCLPKSTASSPPVSPPPPKPSGALITSQEQQEALDNSLSLLNSKNGILSESSKRDSDYIIPTCSCELQDCTQRRRLENGGVTEAGSDLHKDVLQNGISTEGFKVQSTQEQEAEKRQQKEEEEEGAAVVEKHEAGGISKKPREKPQRQRHLDKESASKKTHGTEELKENSSDAVPAAPSKPLPVPQPRKHRRTTLVRQDGVESSVQDPVVEELKQEQEMQEAGAEVRLSAQSQGSGVHGDTLEQCEDRPNQEALGMGDTEADAPVPPPRQTSLSPRLHRMVHTLPRLSKNLPQCFDLDSVSHNREDEEKQVVQMDEEEDGYGDFARYPIAYSLPKQIKLGCDPPLVNARRALSADDQPLPSAPPRKPQRHSLPAPPPPSFCPPAPPHANTPMRELPAPPQEKASWRFSRPCVTFFSRQMPTRSSMPPKSRAPALGSKQRAQSFSAADLAIRASPHKRSLSFRKLLELRLSVKMLPKLLSKSGQSLDCANVESPQEERRRERPSSCIGEADLCGEVEYENVPLYEEIPEYMNLPFHNGRLGWSHDPDAEDSDIYEVQDPYQRCQDHEYESETAVTVSVSVSVSGTVSVTWSLTVSVSAFPQQEDEMKRKKVVHIAQEIMSSEKDFRDAVAKATRQNGKPVVDERILNQILYYLPQLYQLNRDLQRELEERVAHWSDHQRLSDIFVQKGPYLKMYSTYIRQFDNNVALLDEQCRKNPAFAAVVREFEMSPRCASLALKHYLLKPVQRIPQYQLLLTDYLKNLPEDSEDYKDTQAALSIVKEVANHANDIMKQGDNFQKLMQIQYSLNGHHEIVQPGRTNKTVYFHRNEITFFSVFSPEFNDALMYTTPVQSAQYKLNCVLSLAGMKVSKPSQEAYQNELNIESIERSFILSASSATERDEWLEAIAKAIDDYTKKKTTFISSRSQEETDVDSGPPLGSKAPIWIPDLRATMCMICTCEFTLTWRRHHCRACGRVVCQACSANKYYLEYLKNQPARVCDHCFAKLQENSDRCASTSLSPIKSGAFSFTRKQKKIPAALKEVSANTENSSMSGYLNRSKGNKKQWKRLWFVIKNKVLYTYAASEDVAALESQPLLGFFLREEKNGPAQKLQFKLYHKNTLFYIFKADDIPTAQRFGLFQETLIKMKYCGKNT